MKEKMGVIAGKQMSRDEALKILAINGSEKDEPVELDPVEIMERFDILIEKN